MTIKEKYENLKSLLNLYGLNMKIHNGHVTFTDIKTGIVLDTYYKEDEYDYSEDAKEIKTANVKDLLGQASRIFHAVSNSNEPYIRYSIKIDNLEPISIDRFEIDKNGSSESYIKKDQSLNIGIYDFIESKEIFEEEDYKITYDIYIRAKDNKYTKSIFVRDKKTYNDGTIFFTPNNVNQVVSKNMDSKENDLSLDEIINILENTPHIKKALSIVHPNIYNNYLKMQKSQIRQKEIRAMFKRRHEERMGKDRREEHRKWIESIPERVIAIQELYVLTGNLDEMTNNDLLENFGISLEESFYPDEAVIKKVKKHIKSKNSNKEKID